MLINAVDQCAVEIEEDDRQSGRWANEVKKKQQRDSIRGRSFTGVRFAKAVHQ
jgi:hypothetical protein